MIKTTQRNPNTRNDARPASSLRLFALSFWLFPATVASAQSVEIVVRHDGPLEAVATRSAFAPGPAGSRYLDAEIRNASDRSLALEEITLALPWGEALAADHQALVASGGACMFRTPTTVKPAAQAPVESHAFLLGRRGGAHELAAFLTWRTFRSKLTWSGGRLVVTADGESRRLAPGETLQLERLWLAGSPSWQNLLFDLGREIARENKIKLRPPPVYVGWSNWDYYGARFTSRQILDNLEVLVSLGVGANLLQIDGGWWEQCGDYFASNPRIEGGMAQLAREIRRRGIAAGVHLDGARADAGSSVAKEHPEFLVQTVDGKRIAGEPRSDGRPGRFYYDYSHPGARAHMRDALRGLREAGYDYFKLDFLKFSLPEYMLETVGLPRRTPLARHDRSLTSVEAIHLALQAMREGMGEDAFFLACTAEFGPVFGHVDGLRTGGDIDPTYSRFSRACMENGGNFYLNGVVVWNDTDYVVARAREDEDATLVQNPRKTGGDMTLALGEMWAHYVGLFGGPKLSSDNLTILREERRALFRKAVALPACIRHVPLDFWQRARDRDDPYHVFLGEAGREVHLAFFNWSEVPHTYRVANWPTGALEGAALVSGVADLRVEKNELVFSLAPQHSAVVRLDGTAQFDALRNRLEVR